MRELRRLFRRNSRTGARTAEPRLSARVRAYVVADVFPVGVRDLG
jgi:hypothetical protein